MKNRDARDESVALRSPSRLCRDRRGATAIEYGLIAGLIALAIVVSLGSTGSGIGGRWTAMANVAANALGN